MLIQDVVSAHGHVRQSDCNILHVLFTQSMPFILFPLPHNDRPLLTGMICPSLPCLHHFNVHKWLASYMMENNKWGVAGGEQSESPACIFVYRCLGVRYLENLFCMAHTTPTAVDRSSPTHLMTADKPRNKD